MKMGKQFIAPFGQFREELLFYLKRCLFNILGSIQVTSASHIKWNCGWLGHAI
jgi:hypothetical protein